LLPLLEKQMAMKNEKWRWHCNFTFNHRATSHSSDFQTKEWILQKVVFLYFIKSYLIQQSFLNCDCCKSNCNIVFKLLLKNSLEVSSKIENFIIYAKKDVICISQPLDSFLWCMKIEMDTNAKRVSDILRFQKVKGCVSLFFDKQKTRFHSKNRKYVVFISY